MAKEKKLLDALIIYPNERTDSIQRLLNIASTQAKIKEQIKSRTRNIKVKTIRFIPEIGVYVAIYEKPRKTRGIDSLKLGKEKR